MLHNNMYSAHILWYIGVSIIDSTDIFLLFIVIRIPVIHKQSIILAQTIKEKTEKYYKYIDYKIINIISDECMVCYFNVDS